VYSSVGRHEVTTKTEKSQTPKPKANQPTQNKTQQHKPKPPNRGVTGASSWANSCKRLTLYHLDMVWQQKQREEHQNLVAKPWPEGSGLIQLNSELKPH
jgi:hypothetical protein